MNIKVSFFTTILFFIVHRTFFKRFRNPKNALSKIFLSTQSTYQKCFFFSSLVEKDLHDHILIFNVEETLLKSSSLFHYFMLVAFEAGGIIRAFVLLLSYPLICLVSENTGLKIMVMMSFFGLKEDKFRVGRTVLPKFFMNDVGFEMFKVLKRVNKDNVICVSNLPQVMIEGFLKDYLEIDFVGGRNLKVVCGYFMGIMEDQKKIDIGDYVKRRNELGRCCGYGSDDDNKSVIGIIHQNSLKGILQHPFLPHCKEVYLVRKSDKNSWQVLPRSEYPNRVIFHDGRLALTPTPLTSLALFMWVPFGLALCTVRIIISLTLPYDLALPILTYSGLRLTVTNPELSSSSSSTQTRPPAQTRKGRGLLYACNHRTLLDPLYLSFARKKNCTAVTYSLSKISEIIAPIKTVRLTRNRDRDGKMMDRLLNEGDLVVCPEGTTCREPYLLRFSPLFAEMSDVIVPVAMDTHVSMFHGTTAGGMKCLDPVFFLMNPTPIYTVQFLPPVSGSSTCRDGDGVIDSSRSYGVANHVQREIGKALEFECTELTRRDKYMILAGNNGVTCTNTNK